MDLRAASRSDGDPENVRKRRVSAGGKGNRRAKSPGGNGGARPDPSSAGETGLSLDGPGAGDAPHADLADPARIGVLGEPQVAVRAGSDPHGRAVGGEAGSELGDGAGGRDPPDAAPRRSR